MRKRSFITIFLTMLCVLLLFSACEKVEDMGTLPDLSKPYTGEYALKRLMLGDKDFTEKFEYVKLTLEPDGQFLLSYKDKAGQSSGYAGQYEVSTEKGEIKFSTKNGLRTVERTFPMEHGNILIDLKLGTKLLHAEFAFPE